jgi:hypothetical protein
MKGLMFLLFCLLSFSVAAKEIRLAVITSDTDDETTIFDLHTTSRGEIEGLRLIRSAKSGQIKQDETFNYEEVVNDGALLQERDGHEVIKLFTDKFSRENGGIVRVNYLVNGLRGTRREVRLMLQKKGGVFGLYELNGAPVNRMLVKGNYVRLLGLVGVADIVMSYQP